MEGFLSPSGEGDTVNGVVVFTTLHKKIECFVVNLQRVDFGLYFILINALHVFL